MYLSTKPNFMKYLVPLFALLLLFACQKEIEYPDLLEETAHLRDSTLAPFYHGVASGDPLQDKVIIWTRITPEDSLPEVKVTWQVATDDTFKDVVRSGSSMTSLAKDYTVKVDIVNLEPGTTYYYQFEGLEGRSIVGQTKTVPVSAEQLSMGVVSCSNYEWGYFNAYGKLAEEDIDVVVHLGDYIYEYGPGGYGDTTLNRPPIPAREVVSLQDYRTRYSQYRLDQDLRDAHARHPFINVWDDHEISNDSYKDGAQNHQEEEGSYEVRKQAAIQAYYEWQPIREGDKHYRKFAFGNLADLIMLDERLEGRTQQADSVGDPSLMDSSRTMLGQMQLDWMLDNLKNSTAQWKIIGNQVIYSYLDWGHTTFHKNLDSWDGYPIEQQKIADVIKGMENVVFITGDTHTAWAFEVTNKPFDEYDQNTAEGAFAIEFGTTSINSANSNERFTTEEVLDHEKKIVNSPINPHLKYTNMRDHGYMILTLTSDMAMAEWKFVETLSERSRNVKETKKVWVNSGEVKLRE